MSETVLTSRRAWLRGPEGWIAGRLRLTDRRLTFTADGIVVEADLAAVTAVRVTRGPRPALLLDTPAGPVRLRCFAVRAVAQLLFPRSG